MNQPNISVGLLAGTNIHFVLNQLYIQNDTICQGHQQVIYADEAIVWNGARFRELTFTPCPPHRGSFTVKDVTIGIHFHWERQEEQTFQGSLKLMVNEGKILLINQLPSEVYLVSVISSEVKATAPLELLKAHAIISRSWLLAQLDKSHKHSHQTSTNSIDKSHTLLRWYDHEEHELFDVCADDHCQRYQGITRITNSAVREAVKATCGTVLVSNGQICDARFSKCCGGISEHYATCWADKNYPYLRPVRDSRDGLNPTTFLPDLTHEVEAQQWIRSTPEAFCHTPDMRILSRILNAYDTETTPDFYRWRIRYTQVEIADLIRSKTGVDLGQIVDLVPLERGASGRICRLRIEGARQTLIVGKELEIRRILSPTHLLSSAFVVDKSTTSDGIPHSFTFTGAGWGHGVGLCQIGAAVMSQQGYNHQEILAHYYRGANLLKLYDK